MPPIAARAPLAYIDQPDDSTFDAPSAFRSPNTSLICSPPSPIAVGAKWRWLLPIFSGAFLALAFPCHPDSPLAFLHGGAWALVALVPLLVTLSRQSAREGFRSGWVTGSVWSLLSLYWIAYTQGGGPAVVGGTLLIAVYMGLFTGLFAACHCVLMRGGERWTGLLLTPCVWTAVEYLQTLGELGFPWLLLGNSQAAFTGFIQYAEYTGVYGVSSQVVLVNVLLFAIVLQSENNTRRTVGAVGLCLVAVIGPWAFGHHVLASTAAGDNIVRVGLIQNNVGREKWKPGGLQRSLASLDSLSRLAVADGADLLVWPETALPCYVSGKSACRQRVEALVRELQVPILTGAPEVKGATREHYNSAFLFTGGPLPPQSYAKMHLVPFGERTPFRDSIPLVRDIDWSALTGDLGSAEFAPGVEHTLFQHPKGAFSVLICFESAFPDLVRRSAGAGAKFLIIITNDSWFGRTAGPYQHAQLAILRAVETRTAIARCATSGISLFIDRYGRTTRATGLFEQAVRVADVSLSEGDTFYTRHGDLFAWACLLAAVVGLTVVSVSGRYRGSGER